LDGGRTDAHAFADGVLARPEMLRQFVIHDDRQLRAVPVGFGKEAAA
jgi:hypothetical protein